MDGGGDEAGGAGAAVAVAVVGGLMRWAGRRASGRSDPERKKPSLTQSTVRRPTCGPRSRWAVARSAALLGLYQWAGEVLRCKWALSPDS